MIPKEALPRYQQLFCRIFAEDAAFCSRIFSHRLEQVFDIQKQGEILSFLYPIPFEAKVRNKPYRAMYVYGVGTVEHARGRGYMKEVFHKMEDYYKNDVDFYYLVPANEALFSLYETIGYKTGFYLKKELLFPKKDNCLTYEIKEANEEFHSDYLRWISSFDTAVIRTEKDSRFYLESGTYSKIAQSGFFWESDHTAVYLREAYFPNRNTLACFLDFLAKKGYEKVIVTKPEKKTPYAMIKPIHPDLIQADFSSGYTNLNFD